MLAHHDPEQVCMQCGGACGEPIRIEANRDERGGDSIIVCFECPRCGRYAVTPQVLLYADPTIPHDRDLTASIRAARAAGKGSVKRPVDAGDMLPHPGGTA
jgi:hypothetical protein